MDSAAALTHSASVQHSRNRLSCPGLVSSVHRLHPQQNAFVLPKLLYRTNGSAAGFASAIAVNLHAARQECTQLKEDGCSGHRRYAADIASISMRPHRSEFKYPFPEVVLCDTAHFQVKVPQIHLTGSADIWDLFALSLTSIIEFYHGIRAFVVGFFSCHAYLLPQHRHTVEVPRKAIVCGPLASWC
jgi:hypothetical protein